MVGHIAPEASVGGPIAALRENDIITIDISQCRVDVELSEAALRKRLEECDAPPPRLSGVMGKYARLVASASEGATTSA